MNLKKAPSKDVLRRLVSCRDDDAGHHLLWVSVDGDVFLDLIPGDMAPIDYIKSLEGREQFRLETMGACNGYVGPDAARDEIWIDWVYTALLTNYENGATGCVELF